MAKIDKRQFLDGVHKTINEALNNEERFNIKDTFSIKKSVYSLVESSASVKGLLNVLSKYESDDSNNVELLESYKKDLSKYAKLDEKVNAEYIKIGKVLEANKKQIAAIKIFEAEANPMCRTLLEEPLMMFLNEQSDENANNLASILEDLYKSGNSIATKFNFLLEDKNIKIGGNPRNYLTEAYEVDETPKAEKTISPEKLNKVYEAVDNYVNEKLSAAMKKDDKPVETPNKLEYVANKTGINLHESIANLYKKNAHRNKAVAALLEQYNSAIKQGAYQERLYESFISNFSNYSYMLPVETELSALKKRLENNRVEIDLVKIMESMLDTTSYYIVPLIEEDVVRYVKAKNPTNKVLLENCLISFAHDPYVKMMIDTITYDDSRAANCIQDSFISDKDKNSLLKEKAVISNVYSPVQFIKENESVININGTYYTKKGNIITKSTPDAISNLSEKFTGLCKLLNEPNVHVYENHINLEGHDLSAKIYENYIEIDGKKEAPNSFKDIPALCAKYNNFDHNFFVMAACLHECFNDIAKLDFVKHIELKENKDINIDLFKLNENFFIASHNDSLEQHTFFRNVNPINCATIINEHMGIKVSHMFDSLMPRREFITNKLNEMKDEYEQNIEKYETLLDELEDAKKEAVEDKDKEKAEEAIKDTKEKLDDLKKEYKEWQEKVDDATEAKPDDEGEKDSKEDDKYVTSNDEENPNKEDEPLSDDEVEDAIPDLSTSLENAAEAPAPVKPNKEIATEEPDTMDAAGEGEEVTVEEPGSDYDPVEDGTSIFNDGEGDEVVFPDNDVQSEVDFSDNETSATDMPEPEVNAVEEAPEMPASTIDKNAYDENYKYKVTNVMFDQNVKTGERSGTGSVNILVPMISPDGREYVDNKDYKFTIDQDGRVIIATDAPIQTEIYKAIMTSIMSSPKFAEAGGKENPEAPKSNTPAFAKSDFVDMPQMPKPAAEPVQGEANPEPDGVIAPETSETPTSEPAGDELPGTEDPNIAPVDDDKEFIPTEDPDGTELTPEDVDIPVYKDGDTEIEYPAPGADPDKIPEMGEESDYLADGEKDDFNVDDIFASLPEDDCEPTPDEQAAAAGVTPEDNEDSEDNENPKEIEFPDDDAASVDFSEEEPAKEKPEEPKKPSADDLEINVDELSDDDRYED